MKVTRVQIYKDAGGEYRWRALAANHEPVADSGEGYDSKLYALKVVLELYPDATIEEPTGSATNS